MYYMESLWKQDRTKGWIHSLVESMKSLKPTDSGSVPCSQNYMVSILLDIKLFSVSNLYRKLYNEEGNYLPGGN